MHNSSDSGRQATIASVKRDVSETILTLEKAYYGTKYIAGRISKRDRFSAFGVVEKTSVSPHTHLSWTFDLPADVFYDPDQDIDHHSLAKIVAKKSARQLAFIEKNLFICFLLEQCNSPGVALEEREREFLKMWEPYRDGLIMPQVIDWKSKGWSIKTTLIYDAAGWRGYMFKEQLFQPDFSDQIFTLADSHSSNQRTKPTRYCSVDRVTHQRHLNLDEPLKPRR